MLRGLLRLVDGLNEAVGRAMVVVLFFVIGVICYQVVARYVFRAPPEWGYDLMVYPTSVLYVLAGAYALKNGAFVHLDTLVDKLSPRSRRLLDIVTYPVAALFCVAMIWGSWTWAFHSYAMGETTGSPMRLPVWPFKMALLVGSILLFLQSTAKLVRDVEALFHGEDRARP